MFNVYISVLFLFIVYYTFKVKINYDDIFNFMKMPNNMFPQKDVYVDIKTIN